MNMNYEQVPNVITGKDLDYLSDMFEWNYGTYKSTNSALQNVSDLQICEILTKASNLFKDNMNKVLFILNGGSNE